MSDNVLPMLQSQLVCFKFAQTSSVLRASTYDESADAGPVNIHSSVQQAMDRPAQNHRDPWFNPFFSSILEDSKMLFGTTKGTTFIYPGTGTGG